MLNTFSDYVKPNPVQIELISEANWTGTRNAYITHLQAAQATIVLHENDRNEDAENIIAFTSLAKPLFRLLKLAYIPWNV